MKRTPTVIALVALVCLAVVSSLVSFLPADQPEPLRPYVQRSGPVGPVPAGLERFYGQELAWGPCADYATTGSDRYSYANPQLECARLTVPLDYAQPAGPTVSVGLLRQPAADKDERIGSLLLNPGGPGASGMSAAASLGPSLRESELGNRFDLVGFDPRGVASSTPPLRCLTGPERDADRRDSDANNAGGGVEANEREEQEYAETCAQRSGMGLLAHVGTREVVRDLDVLRSALGDPQLTYLGYSYGTRIGSEYAEHFGPNVRAMVLDGAIDPAHNAMDFMLSQGQGFQRAFDRFAGWCVGRADCPLGTNPAGAVEAFQRLTRPLVHRPASTEQGRDLSYEDASTATIQALYAPSLWPQLQAGLIQLNAGDGTGLLSLADNYYGREPDGSYSSVTDSFNAVRCVDDQRIATRDAMREADRRYRQAAPFLDDGQGASAARDMCAFWPVPTTADTEVPQPQVPHSPPAVPVNALVISTTEDPATPYQAGQRLAESLSGSLLTFEGTQHTVFLQGNRCVDAAGMRFLLDLERPEPTARCRE